MLRAIVIDDEEAGIEMLQMLAQRNAGLIRIVASTCKPEEGISLIEDYMPDVVFLDISMPAMSGFELLSKLSFRGFKLIFTTAHKNFALEAIKNKAYDYLLKPIDTNDFKKCVEELYKERYADAAIPKSNALVEVQVKDGIIYIRQKEISRLEASRSYTEFYLDGGQKHVASKSLREFELKLDPAIFYRCHKSHVINLHKVQKFINHEGFYVLMNDGSMVSVSRQNKDELLELLKAI